ncbi:MAG: stage II sporulation protein M [Verrucomicrobiales bacterium]
MPLSRPDFEKANAARWAETQAALQSADLPMNSSQPRLQEGEAKLPHLFRQACSDLSLAQRRMYGERVCEHVNDIVKRGYNAIYRSAGATWERLFRFVWAGFPRLVRQEWRLFWLMMVLFWGPFFAMAFSHKIDPQWMQAVLGPEGMESMEMMYKDSEALEAYRGSFDSDFGMFAFYVFNNIGIDFRTFAGGILFSLGTLFFTVFNGVHLGAATGYAHYACDPMTFYRFTCGHSSVELMGLIVAGMAGMRIGLPLFNPGRLSRKDALIHSGKKSVRLIFGAAGMTFAAALIEGFW